jgi:hypothetical protein
VTPEAARTAHHRKARTHLNLAATYLEGAQGHLRDAGMRQKAGTAERLAREVGELLAAVPNGEAVRA